MKRFFLLLTLLLCFHTAWGHDAEVDGICYKLKAADKTATVTWKGNALFSNGYSGEVVIPEKVTVDGTVYSVTSLEYRCFSMSRLTSITIPSSVTSIGDYCCAESPGLKSIVVAADNPMYDSRENCNAIIETSTNKLIAGCNNSHIPNSVTSLGDDCFYGCDSLSSVTIPNTVTSLGKECFKRCFGLTSITIPESVTSLGQECFRECFSLTSITIPESVTSLGDKCFSRCSGLTSITIPESVTSLGYGCFDNCI